MSKSKYPLGDVLPAYFQAGIAVVADVYQIKVRQLSLLDNKCVASGARIEPLAAYFTHLGASLTTQPYVDYCTVLLAGRVGRRVGMAEVGLVPPLGTRRSRTDLLAAREQSQFDESQSDLALSIVVGWLGHLDGGDSITTFTKIYHRADEVLRATLYRTRFKKIAAALLQERVLERDAIIALLHSS